MKIKCRKAKSRNILNFSVNFTNEEILQNKDQGYDLKCHLIDSPKPYGLTSEYILHDLQLDEAVEEELWINLRYIHKDDKSQVLILSFLFRPKHDFVIFNILLHCGNSFACDQKFRNTACKNVKAILQLLLNRQKGIHCPSCIYMYQKRLSGKCDKLYKFNSW